MAYYSGTAASFTALIGVIINACTDNGWTLAGDIMQKGGCYVQIKDNGPGTASNMPGVRALVGNGAAGGVITDPADVAGVIGLFLDAVGTGRTDWDWPVQYHIHVMDAPNEVYVVVRYHGTFWQHLAFGRSPSPGNPGTGNWFSAITTSLGGALRLNSFASNSATGRWMVGIPFFHGLGNTSGSDGTGTRAMPSQMHGAFADSSGGGPAWSNSASMPNISSFQDRRVSSRFGIENLFNRQPGAAFANTVLLRCQVLQQRMENKVSLIGELGHLRILRNTYIADGDVIEFADERWKVYPAYRKNAAVPDAPQNSDHSGTHAFAIRYDGP